MTSSNDCTFSLQFNVRSADVPVSRSLYLSFVELTLNRRETAYFYIYLRDSGAEFSVYPRQNLEVLDFKVSVRIHLLSVARRLKTETHSRVECMLFGPCSIFNTSSTVFVPFLIFFSLLIAA